MLIKSYAIVVLLAITAAVIGCGSGSNSEILELQATVLAMSAQTNAEVGKEPLPTYTPLPT